MERFTGERWSGVVCDTGIELRVAEVLVCCAGQKEQQGIVASTFPTMQKLKYASIQPQDSCPCQQAFLQPRW